MYPGRNWQCKFWIFHCTSRHVPWFTSSLFALEVECNLDQKDPFFLSFTFIVNANFCILIFAFPESQSQLENLGKIFDFFNWGTHYHNQKNSLQYSRSSWNLIWLSGNNWRFWDIVNYCLSVSDWSKIVTRQCFEHCQHYVKIMSRLC